MIIKLDIEYEFRETERDTLVGNVLNDHPDWTKEEAESRLRRQMSEEFIIGAAEQLYPSMRPRESALFGPVMSQLWRDTFEIDLDPVVFEFFVYLFLSPESIEKVGFLSRVSHHFTRWRDHVQDLYNQSRKRG